jgi:hypothetical protein
MDMMVDLEEATPSKSRIKDVETKRDSNKKMIEEILEVNKES